MGWRRNRVVKAGLFVAIAMAFLCAGVHALELDANNDGRFDDQFKVNENNLWDKTALREILDDDGAGSGLDADYWHGISGTMLSEILEMGGFVYAEDGALKGVSVQELAGIIEAGDGQALGVVYDYEDLRQLSLMKDGAYVYVSKQGISGPFVYRAASTAADNGGTIISSNGPGMWHRAYGNLVESNWFENIPDPEAAAEAVIVPATDNNGYSVDHAPLWEIIDAGKRIQPTEGRTTFVPGGEDVHFTGEVTIGDTNAYAGRTTASYATLQGIGGMSDGDVIYVKGRSAVGDGGEGYFLYDDDNGEAADGGVILDAAGAGDGRWVRKYNGGVNIQWFGAVSGDDIDDYAAFAAAEDIADDNLTMDGQYGLTNSYVYVPAGDWDIAAGSTVTLSRGIKVKGDGSTNTYITHGGGDVAVFDCAPDKGQEISFEGLTIVGAGQATTAGIDLDTSIFRSFIDDVNIRRCQDNISLLDSWTFTIKNSALTNATRNNIRWLAGTQGLIKNCRIDRAGEHGIYIGRSNDNGVVNLNLISTFVQFSGRAGIYALDASVLNINNGYFEGNNKDDGSWADIFHDRSENHTRITSVSNVFASSTGAGATSRFIHFEEGMLNVYSSRCYNGSGNYAIGIEAATSNADLINLYGSYIDGATKISRDVTSTVVNDLSSYEDGKIMLNELSPSANAFFHMTLPPGYSDVVFEGPSNQYIKIDSPANRRNEIQFQSSGTSKWYMGRGRGDEANPDSFYIGRDSGGGSNPAFLLDDTTHAAKFKKPVYIEDSNTYATRTTESYATLAAVTVMSDGDVIYVEGRSAAGDGGEGFFSYDQDSGATADDGTIIDAAGAGDGRWVRHWEEYINVRWFGAKGDNANNDDPAFARARNAAVAAGGGTIYVPVGVYRAQAKLIQGCERVNWQGAGRGTVIAPTSGACVIIANMDGSHSAGFVKDLRLSGENGAITGVDIKSFSAGLIDGLWIEDCTNGILINGDSFTSFVVRDTVVRNYDTYGIQYARTDGKDSGAVFFINVRLVGTGAGVGFEASSTHTEQTPVFLFFDNFIIDNSSARAVVFDNVQKIWANQIWASGTNDGDAHLHIKNSKNIQISQLRLDNSSATGSAIGIEGTVADLQIEQIRTSGPSTAVQFVNSPTIIRSSMTGWDNTCATVTNDYGRLGQMRYSAPVTISSSSDGIDVGGLETLSVNTGANTVVIGGLKNGGRGQKLHIVKISGANDLIIEHAKNVNENILTKDGSDIVLSGYGGVTLVYDGSNWFEVSSEVRYPSAVVVSDAGPVTNLDVTDAQVVRVNTGQNNVTLSGLSGGVAGQCIDVFKNSIANNLIIEANEASGSQKIFTSDTTDLTLSSRGGLRLCFYNGAWYEVGR